MPETETHEIVDFGEPFYNSSCELGEGPIYRPEDNTLHLVDLLSASIYVLPLTAYDVETTRAEVRTLSDAVTAIAFRKDHPGSYVGSTTLGIAFIDEKNGAIEMLKQLLPESARGKIRFNDGAVDCRGRFWAGEMDQEACQIPLSDQPHPPKGRLWRFNPDRTATQMLDGIYCSNGIGWSPDNKYMYYNDSCGLLIRRFDFDAEAGTISNSVDFADFRKPGDSKTPRTAPELPERFLGGEPDGLVMDTEGNIWIAVWNRGCVLCFKPDGELIREVRATDARYTTCPAWGGENLDILFCTSAKLSGQGGSNGGKLWRFDAGKQWDVRGQAKYKFAG